MQQDMFKHPFQQQKKQKLLNYEIKMIEGCTDSLFTEGDCPHQRYLPWNLCDNLKILLRNYNYTLRWIGNQNYSYVFAYFYVVIMGCAANSHFMLQLKSVFYELAEKYLAQFQQKLLIEFLCLIEYSQQRYSFLRKYSKIEDILLKIFKQIEERNSYQLQVSVEPAPSQESSSAKSNNGREVTESRSQIEMKLVSSTSNSNANNHGQEQRYRMGDKSLWKSKQQYSFVKWYEIYNQYFSFLCMEYLSDENIKLSIDLPKKTILDIDSFVVTVEKGCFFIVELTPAKKMGEIVPNENRQSIVQVSKAYVNQLIEKQIQESQIRKNTVSFTSPNIKDLKNQKYTPKLTTKKGNFLNKTGTQNGAVNDNVQYIAKQKTIKQVMPEETPSSQTSIIPLKTKAGDLHSLKNAIDSHRPQRLALRQQIKSHPLYEDYKKTMQIQLSNEMSPTQKKNSRFVQFIRQKQLSHNSINQNKSLDSSTQRVTENSKNTNPNTNAQPTPTQYSMQGNLNITSERGQSKVETGVTLPTDARLPISSKFVGRMNNLNVRHVNSPPKRLQSTSPVGREVVVPKVSGSKNQSGVLKKRAGGHGYQLSFSEF